MKPIIHFINNKAKVTRAEDHEEYIGLSRELNYLH